MLRIGATPVPAFDTLGGPLGRRADTARYELSIERFGTSAATHEFVRRARGVDVAIVIAGAGGTARALRDLRVLTACGLSRAVILVPPHTSADLVENLARHLM